MGLFDYVRCECPLPDLADPTNIEFQTKDLDRWLEEYRITSAGRLEHWPDEKDTSFHGMLNFYCWLSDKPGLTPDWFEYEAKFTDGQLVSVRRVEER